MDVLFESEVHELDAFFLLANHTPTITYNPAYIPTRGAKVSPLEQVPTEILAQILADDGLSKQDVMAMGRASKTLWHRMLQYVRHKVQKYAGPWVGTELIYTDTYLKDVPDALEWAKAELDSAYGLPTSDELDGEWILRDLTSKEFIRCRVELGSRGRVRTFVQYEDVDWLEVEDVLISRLRWTGEQWSKARKGGNWVWRSRDVVKAGWVGHAFDIVPRVQETNEDLKQEMTESPKRQTSDDSKLEMKAQPRRETDGNVGEARWADVTEIVVEEIVKTVPEADLKKMRRVATRRKMREALRELAP